MKADGGWRKEGGRGGGGRGGGGGRKTRKRRRRMGRRPDTAESAVPAPRTAPAPESSPGTPESRRARDPPAPAPPGAELEAALYAPNLELPAAGRGLLTLEPTAGTAGCRPGPWDLGPRRLLGRGSPTAKAPRSPAQPFPAKCFPALSAARAAARPDQPLIWGTASG